MESPVGRRSICYDREALEKRKDNKPQTSAIDMAKDMGIELLDEEQYKWLESGVATLVVEDYDQPRQEYLWKYSGRSY